MPGEVLMIELTKEQAQALGREADKPPVIVDPLSGQQYRLIKEEVYQLMQGVVRPLNRGWDNPEDDDLIRKDA
jgi:hypothetical protein